jgi:glucokinase
MATSSVQDEFVLAVDIGGTKIATAVITTDGHILHRLMEPTLQKGPQAGIDQIIRLLEKLIQQSNLPRDRFVGVGIGIPAVLEKDSDFIVWGPNLKDWRQVDLRGALERHFNLPVSIEYDGHTAVLGEWWQGVGKGYHTLVSVIIGTGVGGGMVLDGRLARGVNRLAGAVGWFILDPHNRSQAERERSLGSWEARIAGPGLAQRARYLLESDPPETTTLRIEGSHPSAADVFEAARQGDPLAVRITTEEAELLGMGLANIVSLVNPEIIILGGSVGSHSEFLLPQVKQVIDRYAQPISAQSVKVVTSQLGTDAGLLGAAYGLILRS